MNASRGIGLAKTARAGVLAVGIAAVLLGCSDSEGSDDDAGTSPARDGGAEDDGRGAPSGDGDGDGSVSTGSGGARDAGSGGSAVDGGAGGSDGGGGDDANDAPACAPGTGPTDRCDAVDDLCASEAGCCRCVRFDAAGCGLQWSCATPGNNLESCPAEPPAVGQACEAARNVCQYCTAEGPTFMRCGMEIGADTGAWLETTGLDCSAGG